MSITLSRPETENAPHYTIPAGTYSAKFVGIDEVENKSQPNSQYPDSKWWPTKWAWKFEITEPNFETDDGATVECCGLMMKGKTNPTIANEKAKGFKWLAAIIKRDPFKGEDLNDTFFTGYPCMIEIGEFEKDDEVWSFVKDVSRAKQGKMLPYPSWVTTPAATPQRGQPAAPQLSKSGPPHPIEVEDLPFDDEPMPTQAAPAPAVRTR